MTEKSLCTTVEQETPRPSLLPFDPADLVAMRVLPAQFARMVGVSKQCVSQWIQRGVITLGPDGKIDPAKASREVIERTDPGRLRARVFKQATASFDELRERISHLEEALEVEKRFGLEREKAAGYRAQDEANSRLSSFCDALAERLGEAVAAQAAGHLEEWLDELCAVEFYGCEPEEIGEVPDDGEAAEADALAVTDEELAQLLAAPDAIDGDATPLPEA